MSDANQIEQLIAPYEPQLPLDQLVEEVNRIFHEVDARYYDDAQAGMHKQLAPMWAQMIKITTERTVQRPWNIIDFGCGTGFASSQILDHIPADDINQLVCYDPSQSMLAVCREKISPRLPASIFLNQRDQLAEYGPFNLFVTNSVLHHLPLGYEAIHELTPFLADDAVWIASHEPSQRFYRNEECVSYMKTFQQEYKWRRYLQPNKYINRLKRMMGYEVEPYEEAAKKVVQAGVFKRQPPIQIIGQLVDFHVPQFERADDAQLGFDIQAIEQSLAPQWRLIWDESYNFIGGANHEARLSSRWRKINRELAEKYPQDGASFSAVWQRASI